MNEGGWRYGNGCVTSGEGFRAGATSSWVPAIGSFDRVVPTMTGCAAAGAGSGGRMMRGGLDSDRVLSGRSASLFSGRWDVESTGVTLGVGSGLLVKVY